MKYLCSLAKRGVRPFLGSFFCIAISHAVIFAGSVVLDTGFNGSGYRIQSISPDGAIGQGVAIHSDGRIVLGGFTLAPAFYGSFAAMQLTANGSLDVGFDTDGYVITTVNNFNRGDTTLIQPDGKILLGGERYFGTSNNDFTVLRYNSNGTLDSTFDGNGVASWAMSGFSDDHSYDMALQSDGKIVLVGTSDLSTTINQNLPTDIAIMRLNANGSPDSSFNGGYLIVRFEGVSEAANAIAVQSDGKYVLGGFLTTGANTDFLLMRLNPNATLDTTFGQGGLTVTSVIAGSDAIKTLALQSDGKILAGGSGHVARYTTGGVLDQTFGSGGIAVVPHSVEKILTLPGDKFTVGGSSGTGVAVSRWNTNGTADQSFNGNGRALASVPGTSCEGTSMALQNDSKIVIGGSCTSNGRTDFAVFRFREIQARAPFDFDGDGKTEVGIFRPGAGEWWYARSSDNQVAALQFGTSTDRIAPADFTGDGKTDIAIWRPASGEWYILRSEDNSFLALPFGANGDVPVPADYDADSKADIAVFRPSNSTWYILQSAGGGVRFNQFGTAGDVPVVADYDGDAKADIAIFRPAQGEWWINRSTAGLTALQFGSSADKPVQGDYTGDGKADIAFWRPVTGQWNILRSEDLSYLAFPFGANGDIPTPGDYDGDGKYDTAVFRPSQSTWFLNRSTAGVAIQQFGTTGDRPIPNAFVP